MLPQIKEFEAWGLSKIAVRNIVVFFICCLIAAIGIMARVIHVLNAEKSEQYQKLVECKELVAVTVEKLKEEQLIRMDSFYRRQEITNNKLEKLNYQLYDLRKKR